MPHTFVIQEGLNNGFSSINMMEHSYHSIITFIDFYISEHENIILTFWFLVIFIKLIVLLVEIHYIYNLGHKGLIPVTDQTKRIFFETKAKLSMSKDVQIFESKKVRSPLVIGFLNPKILLPFGITNRLSGNLLEAIIAHELCHIKRKDYIINFFQRLIEIIYFFNPIIKWISSRTRFEREICCDQIAVSVTNKASYIKALLACEEHNSSTLSFGFSGIKNTLLKRVEIILSKRNFILNKMESGILLCNFVFFISLSVTIICSKNLNHEFKEYFTRSYESTAIASNPYRVNKDQIVTFLKNNGVRFNPNSFSLKITNYALYMDGIKQSKKNHQTVLQTYVLQSDKRLNFTCTVKKIFD